MAPLPVTQEYRMPPTPRRQLINPNFTVPRDTDPHWQRPSVRARSDRKRSVYINADNCFPSHIPPQQQQQHNSINTGADISSCKQSVMEEQLSSPSSWAHLLPYRTSTIPPNLAERLKKSEPPPEDGAYRHKGSFDSSPYATEQQQNRSLLPVPHTENNYPTPKSPPPRPPTRTTSQVFTCANRSPCTQTGINQAHSCCYPSTQQQQTSIKSSQQQQPLPGKTYTNCTYNCNPTFHESGLNLTTMSNGQHDRKLTALMSSVTSSNAAPSGREKYMERTHALHEKQMEQLTLKDNFAS